MSLESLTVSERLPVEECGKLSGIDNTCRINSHIYVEHLNGFYS
jgi:hypothetical protein